MSAFDASTLDFYAANAVAYLEHRPDEVSEELLPFLARLKPGARILELGCGGGRDAAAMIACGFDVEPTDGVAAMAGEAERLLGSRVRVMRFDEIDAVEAYDAVVAMASLLHAPKAALPDVLHRIWRALAPGGQHLATFKTAAAPGHDEHGRYYNYPSRDEAEAMYRVAGEWAAIDFHEAMGVGYFSTPARWLTVTAVKCLTP